MIGGLVAGMGFCFCSISSSDILFSSGIAVAGFGYSFLVISNIVIVKDYFADSYAVAVSFSFAGGGVGIMLLPVLTEKLANIYGWRGTLLILAGLNFHNVVAGALFRPLISNRRQYSASLTPENVRGAVDGYSDSAEENGYSESSTNNIVDLKDQIKGASGSANEPEHDCKETSDRQSTTHPSHEYECHVDFEKRTNAEENCKQSSGTSENDDEISIQDQLASIGQSSTDAHTNDLERECLLKEEKSDATTNDRIGNRGVLDIFDLRLMSDYPAINLVMIAGLLSGATITGWVAFLVPYGQEKGYEMNEAVLLATLGGSGNIIGRFGIGYTIGKRTSARALFVVCNIICGVAFCLNYVTSAFWGLSILATINGLTLGAMTVLICLMIEEIVDDSRFASGVALTYFFLGLGEIVGGLFAGWIHDKTHTYDLAFISLGSLNFFGALFTLLTLSPCSR